jgi:endonuclease/exonuclease/phosphatase family metal-dependent hydrolase
MAAIKLLLGAVYVLICIGYGRINNFYYDLLAYTLPLFLFFYLFTLLWTTFHNKDFKLGAVYFVLLLLGYTPIRDTVAINIVPKEERTDWKIISYNVSTFNHERIHSKESDTTFYNKFYAFIKEVNPDILCLQEFYFNDINDADNTLSNIVSACGFKYYYINPLWIEEINGFSGVITFSKEIPTYSTRFNFTGSGVNRGTIHYFAKNKDTIQLINLHMHSMSIRPFYYDTLGQFIGLKESIYKTYEKLQRGFHKRDTIITQFDSLFTNNKYKSIICTDLNATPYSYIYQYFKKNTNNSFSAAGNGFGYTYRFFPWLLRIDNVFVDKQLNITQHKVHNNIKISDHYPLEVGVSVR